MRHAASYLRLEGLRPVSRWNLWAEPHGGQMRKLSRHVRTSAAALGAAALLGTVLAALPATAATRAATPSGIPAGAASLGLTHCDAYGGPTICSGSVASFDGASMDLDLTLPAPNTG